MKIRAYRLWELNAANLITLCNMIFGSLSIICTVNQRYNWAIACIGFAGVADRYDGMVARHYQTDSPLGVQLDSLGDIISFGVAPAILAYVAQFQDLQKWPQILGAIACILFIAAGAFRLARFNVIGMSADGFFTGVPIPIAGALLAISMLFRRSASPYLYMLFMLLLGSLEISKLRIRKR